MPVITSSLVVDIEQSVAGVVHRYHRTKIQILRNRHGHLVERQHLTVESIEARRKAVGRWMINRHFGEQRRRNVLIIDRDEPVECRWSTDWHAPRDGRCRHQFQGVLQQPRGRLGVAPLSGARAQGSFGRRCRHADNPGARSQEAGPERRGHECIFVIVHGDRLFPRAGSRLRSSERWNRTRRATSASDSDGVSRIPAIARRRTFSHFVVAPELRIATAVGTELEVARHVARGDVDLVRWLPISRPNAPGIERRPSDEAMAKRSVVGGFIPSPRVGSHQSCQV